MQHPRARTLPTATLGLLAIAACSDAETPAAAGPVVRDSAGATIVDNPAPTGAETLGWEIDPEPILVVGQLDGDAPYLLSEVRTPLLRSDGVLVLGNRATQQVRAFTPDGRLAWEAGGQGSGPGEFESLSWLGLLPGDSVVVSDGRNRRITVLDPSGTFSRSYTPEPIEGAPSVAPIALLDDGRVVLSGGVSFSGGEGSARELVWDSAPYVVADAEGRTLASLPPVRSSEFVVFRDGGSVGIAEPPIPRTGFIAGRGTRVVSGDGRALDLAIHDPTGRLVRRVRLDAVPLATDPGDRDRAMESRLRPDADAEGRRVFLDLWEGIDLPATRPVADAVRLEADGTIWVRRWIPDWESDGGERWRIFDPEGSYQGEAQLPADFALASLDGDRLVGIHTDELGVEQVRVYRRRPAAP